MDKEATPNPSNALKKFAKFTSQVIFAYDIENNCFTYLSPAFKHVWEKSKKSAVADSLSLLETVHPEDREYVINHFQKLMNGEDGNDIEFRIQFSDKSVKWLCLSAVINKEDPNASLIIGRAEDVTVTKEKNALLKKSVAKKASVLEILAHDLAGPLKSIKGLSSLMTEELKESNEFTRMSRSVVTFL